MPFLRPNLSTLLKQARDDVAAGGMPGVGVPVPGGFLWRITQYLAGLASESYSYLDWIAKQSVPWTATGEHLHAWASLRGVEQKDATPASGTIQFTGTSGSVIAQGTVLLRSDGAQFATQAEAQIGAGGTATVAITAVEPGAAGNTAQGASFTLTNPILGVQGTATATTEIGGGTDLESDELFRSRMLRVYQQPPQGGAIRDYEQWALEIPAVTRAWCNPHGEGLGTVVLYVMMDELREAQQGFPQGTDGGAALETRVTTATGDQLMVADVIYPLRPATAMVHVKAPTAHDIDITIANLSANTQAIRDSIQVAIKAKLYSVATALGGTVYPSDINAAIDSVAGVDRFTLSSPTAPVTIPLGSVPVLGTLTIS